MDGLKVSPSVGSKSALVSRVPEGRVAWVETKIEAGDKTYPAMIVLPLSVAMAVAEEFYATTDPAVRQGQLIDPPGALSQARCLLPPRVSSEDLGQKAGTIGTRLTRRG